MSLVGRKEKQFQVSFSFLRFFWRFIWIEFWTYNSFFRM